ncbi:MAG TPA: Hpt domain-containing protein [Acidobacteriaceae bacterium]|jgi:HPt (histidine-containing phosphotransfer) domain-containing protein|nr:Hpt domain-containing protein [Acidobacteriaceae bacterium]
MSASTGNPGEVARQLIAALWERSVPLICERLEELDRASNDAVHGSLSPAARASAAETAHKLAGSLGMFGYPRGTELARDLEQVLEAKGAIDAITLCQLVASLRASLPL